jgi:acetyltransferase-like isoleucine patch superfamily enzyme
VIRDIPDNTIVVGNPQRVLVKEEVAKEVQKLAAA